MTDLIAYLRARLDEEELLAIEASRDKFGGITETGEHWRWECERDDSETPLIVDQEFVKCPTCESVSVGLRSIEVYPSKYGLRGNSHLALQGVEEVSPIVARHIAAWDPARVLADVAVKRRIIDAAERAWQMQGADLGGADAVFVEILEMLAQSHADRPDFDPAWRLEPPRG